MSTDKKAKDTAAQAENTEEIKDGVNAEEIKSGETAPKDAGTDKTDKKGAKKEKKEKEEKTEEEKETEAAEKVIDTAMRSTTNICGCAPSTTTSAAAPKGRRTTFTAT